MDTAKLNCRICKSIQNHTVFANEVPMPDNVALVQCRGCGVMGVEQIKEKPNGKL